METLRKKLKQKLAKGFIVVEYLNNPTLSQFRESQCHSCPNYDKDKDECEICGCIIELKVLTKTNRNPHRGSFQELMRGGIIEKTHCPEGRWLDKTTAKYYEEKYGI